MPMLKEVIDNARVATDFCFDFSEGLSSAILSDISIFNHLIANLIENKNIESLLFNFGIFNMNPQFVNDILRVIAANPRLKKLSLHGRIYDRAEVEIVDKLINTGITELHFLRTCGHHDYRAPAALANAVARLLKASETITHLTLDGCGFTDSDTQILAEGVSKNTSLTHLALGGTYIRLRGQTTLADMLAVSRHLMSFKLVMCSYNQDPARLLFVEALQADTTVESLQVIDGFNKLHGSRVKPGIYLRRDPKLAPIIHRVKKAMFVIPEDDCYVSTCRLTIDILAFRFSSTQRSLRANVVLSSLKNELSAVGCDLSALDETHYLKEFERYILGYANALMLNNKKCQYRALLHLMKPFEDNKLGKEADILMMGIINNGIMQDFPGSIVKRAVDYLLLALYLSNSYRGDSYRFELSAYFRLYKENITDKTREDLHTNPDLCLNAFSRLINAEATVQKQNRAEFIETCRATIIQGLSQALKQVSVEPASHLKTVGFFPQVSASATLVKQNVTLKK